MNTQTLPLPIGTFVKYENGNRGVFQGNIMANTGRYYVIIDNEDKAGMELWNAGVALGDCISPEQIKEVN